MDVPKPRLPGQRAKERPVPVGGGGSRSTAVAHPPGFWQRAAAMLVVAGEKLLALTLRVSWEDRSGLLDPLREERVIFVLWHNRLAISMDCYRRFLLRRRQGRKLAALISASRDGALLACILDRFGVRAVRGSSSRRGGQAMLELTTAVKEGCDVAITPDGPRGPRYQFREGALALAQVTRMPVIPVNIRYDWKLTLGSWDRFQLPLPGSKVRIETGPAVRVPEHMTESRRKAVAAELEAALEWRD